MFENPKQKRLIAWVLAVLMALSAVPVIPALAAAYTVLLQTTEYASYDNTYYTYRYHDYNAVADNTVIMRSNENNNRSYYLGEYTGSGIREISDHYKSIGSFSESGFALVQNEEGKYGVINQHGQIVVPPGKYERSYTVDSNPTDDGYATMYYNSTGAVLLNLKDGTETGLGRGSYGRYNNGLIPARTNNAWVYQDMNGSTVINTPYKWANEFSHGYAVVGNTVYEIIDTQGNVTFRDSEKKYEDIGSFSTDGIAAAKLKYQADVGYRYEYIDRFGNVVIREQYDEAGKFYHGYAVVNKIGKGTALIDTNGNEVIPFGTYDEMSNVSNTGLLWATIRNVFTDTGSHSELAIAKMEGVGSEQPAPDPAPNPDPEPEVISNSDDEYIYDEPDPGDDVILHPEYLDDVTDTESAVAAVRRQLADMTDEQKQSATGIDLATLFAETAVSRAARTKVTGSEILINAAAANELEEIAARTTEAVESALVEGGVSTARYLSDTIILETDETGEINIRIAPDILTTETDKIRVEAPNYALTVKTADLADDLTDILSISTQDLGIEPESGSIMVGVAISKGTLTNPVTLSLPPEPGDIRYQTVVSVYGNPDRNPVPEYLPFNLKHGIDIYKQMEDTDKITVASKNNPATATIDGKILESGNYAVRENAKDFTDISNKSKEMQDAIRYLASKGVIYGTTETTFSPDDTINRAQIVALIMRALGKANDTSLRANFTDVSPSDWYYYAAAASQKNNIILGYSDGSFRGGNIINRGQIYVVSGRILVKEMRYKAPTNPESYLSKYEDDIADWAKPMIALATRENLIVKRKDGRFYAAGSMTRGNAAIALYRLFKKMW